METLTRVQKESLAMKLADMELFHGWRFCKDERQHLHQLVDWFNPQLNKIYVDCGCGRGTILRYLFDNHHGAGVGINIDKLQVKECLGKGVPTLEGSYTDINLPSDFADVVIFTESFCYADPDIILPEVNRLLRDTGEIWIKDFFFNGTAAQRKNLFSAWKYLFLRKEEWETFFFRNGFRLSWETFPAYTKHFHEAVSHMKLDNMDVYGADVFEFMLAKAVRI